MGHPRAVKNLDGVIEEIESRLDEKDEVRELTIKSSHPQYKLIKIPIYQAVSPPSFVAPKPAPQPLSVPSQAIAAPKPASQPIGLPAPSANKPPLPPGAVAAAKGQ